MEKDKNKTAAPAAALTLGIVSIVTALFWYVALPTGVIAIVLGAKSAKRLGSKLGKAGLITGIIGVSLMTFIYITMVLLIILAQNYY